MVLQLMEECCVKILLKYLLIKKLNVKIKNCKKEGNKEFKSLLLIYATPFTLGIETVKGVMTKITPKGS